MSNILAVAARGFLFDCACVFLVNSPPSPLAFHAVFVFAPSDLLFVLFLVGAWLIDVWHRGVEWNSVPFDYPCLPLCTQECTAQ